MNEIPSSYFGDSWIYFNVKSLISDLTLVKSKNQNYLLNTSILCTINTFPDEEATIH